MPRAYRVALSIGTPSDTELRRNTSMQPDGSGGKGDAMDQYDPEMQEIPVKVYRSTERVMVAAPMPGVEPEDISVEVQEHGIMLHGDMRGRLKGDKDAIINEWNPGGYHR